MEIHGLKKHVTITSGALGHTSGVDLGKKLIEAAKNGNEGEVRELMGKGAPFTTDWLGTSPLHYAAQNGHVNTTHLLMRAGMSMDARTKIDKTPLHFASQHGQKDTVNALIKIGANINAQDMLLMTPLHWAVEEQHLEVIIMLVESKADLKIKSKFDKTAFDIAMDKSNIVIANYLANEEKKTPNTIGKIRMKQSEPSVSEVKNEQAINLSIPANSVLANLAALVGLSSFNTLPSTSSTEALSWLQAEMLNASSSNSSISVEAGNSISLTEGGKLALQACSKQTNGILEDNIKETKDESKDSMTDRYQTTNQEHSNNINKQAQSQFISLLVNGQVVNIPTNQLFVQPSNQQSPFMNVNNVPHPLLKQPSQDETASKKRKIEKSSLVVSDVLMHNTTNTDSYINSMLNDDENDNCSSNEDEVLDLERDILQKQLERARREAKQCREELKKKEMEAEIFRKRLAQLNNSSNK